MPPSRSLVVALVAALLCALAPSVASAATFNQRFSRNDSVDIAIVANTLETCPPGQTNGSGVTCETTRAITWRVGTGAIVGTRAYQTCTVKRPTVKPPRI